MSDVFHLGLTRDQLQGATIAILPGDPDRVAKIAERFDRSEPRASKREFTSALAVSYTHLTLPTIYSV